MPDEPTTPAAPAAPTPAPAPPAQTPQPGQVVEPTAPAATPSQDDQEWDQALASYKKDQGFDPGKPKAEEPKKDEQAKPEEKSEATSEAQTDSKDQKPDEKSGSGDDSKKEGGGAEESGKPGEEEPEAASPDNSVREARATQRKLAEEAKTVQQDLRKELFSDIPDELQDADGDPIRTIEDVMQRQNPNTGKPFTEEEAAAWLLAAQQNLNQKKAEADKKVEQITDTLLSLKDQSENIKLKYGKLLEANPNGIRERVWNAFQKTLVRDKETNIIVDAPVSLEEFYEAALAPYVLMHQQMEKDAQAKEEADKKAEAAKQEAERAKDQSDRQDIYSGGKSETQDSEEKEWEQAAKRHYEGV